MYLDLLNLKFYQLFCIEMGEVTKKGKKLPFILLATTNILNGERLKAFPLTSETRRTASVATFIQHSTESASQSN